jgi:hypothetical protein
MIIKCSRVLSSFHKYSVKVQCISLLKKEKKREEKKKKEREKKEK